MYQDSSFRASVSRSSAGLIPCPPVETRLCLRAPDLCNHFLHNHFRTGPGREETAFPKEGDPTSQQPYNILAV